MTIFFMFRYIEHHYNCDQYLIYREDSNVPSALAIRSSSFIASNCCNSSSPRLCLYHILFLQYNPCKMTFIKLTISPISSTTWAAPNLFSPSHTKAKIIQNHVPHSYYGVVVTRVILTTI